MSKKQAMGRIIMIAAPRGEAPEWVRKAWIGVELPCYPHTNCTLNTETGKHNLHGVITGKVVAPYIGYTVPQESAIEALEKKDEKAARWWRDHGFPMPGLDFHFEESAAKAISGVKQGAVVDDMETGRFEVPGER